MRFIDRCSGWEWMNPIGFLEEITPMFALTRCYSPFEFGLPGWLNGPAQLMGPLEEINLLLPVDLTGQHECSIFIIKLLALKHDVITTGGNYQEREGGGLISH